MKNNQIFKKYNSRLVAEGVINSVLCGLSVGGAVSCVVSLICMLCNSGLALLLGLAIGLGVGSAAISGVLLYFFKFRPTDKTVARRVDATGLEERAITMLEFANDDSFMARRQREDATVHLTSAVTNTAMTLAVSVATIVCAVTFTLAGTVTTTVGGLMADGVIPPIIQPDDPFIKDNFIEVSYLVEEGGEIDGDEAQLILPGENAEPVMAVPEEGWAFKEWSDGETDPFRCDLNISEDFTVTAVFEEVPDDGEGGESDGEGKDSDDSDDDSQKPSEDNSNSNEEEQPSDPSDSDDDEEEQPDNPQSGAGGRYEEKNQIINGETYYRDVEYMESVIEKLTSGSELTQEEREFIEKYFGSI